MPYYLAEVRDSDGNDCSVFDVLIGPAADREEASAILWAKLDTCYPDDEHDGGYGTFHPCSCIEWCAEDHGEANDCPAHNGTDPEEECTTAEGCEGHGGLLADEPDQFEEYATEEELRDARARYHTKVDLIGETVASLTAAGQ